VHGGFDPQRHSDEKQVLPVGAQMFPHAPHSNGSFAVITHAPPQHV
jgi:hypothetical protein